MTTNAKLEAEMATYERLAQAFREATDQETFAAAWAQWGRAVDDTETRWSALLAGAEATRVVSRTPGLLRLMTLSPQQHSWLVRVSAFAEIEDDGVLLPAEAVVWRKLSSTREAAKLFWDAAEAAFASFPFMVVWLCRIRPYWAGETPVPPGALRDTLHHVGVRHVSDTE